jgi:hypothetical protein
MNDNEYKEIDTAQKKNSPRLKNIGLFLLALSFLLYSGLLLIPFVPYAAGTKAAIASVLIVTGEISFWVGGLILGKELISRYRKQLNPLKWFKKD